MHRDFVAPPIDCRPRPFWFWNGPLDAERVRAQVAAMAAGGCGGFFLHPRQGMGVPYLSSGFFALVRTAVEAAAAHGLEAWLYDEFPYPSGNAAGLVTVDPALRAVEMKPRVQEVESAFAVDLPLGRLRCALAVPVRGGDADWRAAVDLRAAAGVIYADDEYWRWRLDGCPYNEERYLTATPRWRLAWKPPGGRWRIILCVEHERTGFKYFDHLVDPIAPGAAAAFLASTHERYRAAVGDHFGRTIPGIFSDEVEAPHWSPHLLPELTAAGFDPVRDLPALACADHPQADRWRLAVRRLALARFRRDWEQPVAAWCRTHGLRWVAEKPAWTPDQLLASDVVGIDAGHVRADHPPAGLPAMLRANPRAAQAAAAQRGTGEVLVECFHSLGWGARLLDQRWGFSWLGVQGASRFTPHAFYVSTAGLRKHDAPPSFFLGTPAWSRWRGLADDTARWSWALSVGSEVVEAAVLHPTAGLACAGADEVRAAYERLLADALARQRIVHPVDGAVLTAADGLRAGRMAYPALIVPPLGVAGADEDRAVRAASAAGVPVLLIGGPPPRCEEGVDASAWLGLPGVRNCTEPWSSLALPVARLTDGDGVLLTLRRDGDRTIVLLANPDGRTRRVGVAVAGIGSGWSQWSTDDGRGAALAGAQPTIELPPWGRAVVVHGVAAPAAAPATMATLPETGWTLTAPTASWLRLDRWRIALGADVPAADGLLHPVRPLRWRDANAWQWRRLGGLPDPAGGPVTYACDVHCRVAVAGVDLVIEDGAIAASAWRVRLDGLALDHRPRPLDLLGGDRVGIRLPDLAPGVHVLSLHLDGVHEMGGLTGPVHLHGGFGVDATGALMAVPQQAPLADPHPPGLPFHSDPLHWERVWDPGSATAVALAGDRREVVDLHVDGQDLGTCAWPPYRWTLPPGAGPRRFRLTVRGTLLPLFTGQRWDDARGAAVPILG